MLKRTSAEEIRRVLAARIVASDLPPGTTLDESALAADFAVSRTPVREALRLLAASGLIEQKPHRKAVVAQPDKDRLAGMFEVMSYLEALCAGLCAVAMTAGEREALDRLHTRMAGVVRLGDGGAYAEANDRFHSAIYQGSHNPYLIEVTRSTRERLQPFRRAQFGALGRLTQSHREHGLVVEAILRGNRDEAEAAMRQHISIVGHVYQEMLEGLEPPAAAGMPAAGQPLSAA